MVTAITLSIGLLCGVVAYVAWAMHMVAAGANGLWFIVAAPFVAMAFPAAFAAISFTVSWLFRAPRPSDKHLDFSGMLRLYWREVWAIARSPSRMIVHRWLMADPAPAPSALPILLVHGVLCNAGMMHPMKRNLALRGIGSLYALSYGPPLASIELFAEQMAQRIESMLAATGARQIVVVAHSMGGLVTRAYLRRYGGSKIRRVVTVGTPHHGSVLAYICPGVCLAQMRPGNAWLAELERSERPADPPVISLWSWHDSMVAPQTSAMLDRASNVALAGIGHNALLRDAQVLDLVVQEIERAKQDQLSVPGETKTIIERVAAA